MGTDKALLDIGGETLLDRAVRRLREVADPVIIAAGSRPLTRRGCLTVTDAVPGRGPLAGIVAALEVSPHELCAVVAVDMPNVDPTLLRWLASLHQGEDAVVPLGPRGAEPLHAVYARSILATAREKLASGDVALRRLLDGCAVRWVEVEDVGPPGTAGDFAENLNCPEQLMAWRRDRDRRDGAIAGPSG